MNERADGVPYNDELQLWVLLQEFVARLKSSLCIAVVEGIYKPQINTGIDEKYAIISKTKCQSHFQSSDLTKRTVNRFELPFLSGIFRGKFIHSKRLYNYDF